MFHPSVRHGLRRTGVMFAMVALLASVAGPMRAADPAASSGHDPARMARIADQLRATAGGHDHDHADAAPHEHGGMASLSADDLAYLGLRPGRGDCAGMYELTTDDGSQSCSHGLDVSVPDVATGKAIPPPPGSSNSALAADCSYDITDCPAPAGWKVPTQIPCYSTGPFVEVLYVYWGAGAFATNKERIRRAVASIDLLFKISAAAVKSSTGVAGNRHVRWAMNAGCDLKITPVKMSDSVGDGIYSIKSSLLSRGIITSSRKYLAFVANGGCYGGIAELDSSSKKGSTNPSNSGGSLGMTYDCFDTFDPYAGYGANIAAHELMHTLGAVQDDAPHSTGGHCWDDLGAAHTGADIMCYDDGGVAASKFYARCPSTYPETFDCGKDDYYNPYPPANSYLATRFNPADNKFLSNAEPPAWQQLPKPVVAFTKPSASGGAVGGGTLATIKESGVAGIPIRTVAWTVNGVAVESTASAPTSLGRSTFKTRTGGYANGSVLTIGAKVSDSGGLTGSGSTKVTVANPYVRITTPGAFAETSGTASWTATATASGGRTVAKVEFLVDDVVKATDTTAPYGGTYTVPAFTPGWSGDNGPYTVAARVTDSAGVARKTLSRTLYHQHAGIAWIGPSLMNGGTWVDGPLRVPAGKTVPLTVRAWSSSALGIQRVVFRVNGVTVATDYSAPYTYDYVISSTLGTQVEVTTRAIDGAGTIVTSDPIYIKSVSTYGSQTPTITPDPVSSGADVTFKLTTTPPSGGVIDSACLYVDGDYGDGCLYPSSSSENTITVPAATFGVGGHTASWHLTGNTKADYTGTYVQVDSGYRRFTVTGSTSTPTVAVTGLTTGGRYKGKVNVGATVTGLSSAVTVQQVEFFEGGSSLGLDYDASYTWSWNSAVGPDGPRTIAAEVTLSDGSHLRGSIDVIAANASAKLSTPLAGATVSGVTTLSGTGTYDSDTALESALFFVDGAVVNTDRSAPFSYGWNSAAVANGPHTVAIRLQLTDGRTITTPATSITVAN